MRTSLPQPVEILRDYFDAHRLLRTQGSAAADLRFDAIQTFISDDDGSVLFRLKERCHALFRGEAGVAPTPREALFDLAMGALFHEAMKLRENLYQREVYGPRVRALRPQSGEESKSLFDEFEKMLADVDLRLEEGLREVEVLFEKTGEQLRILLKEYAGDGFTARFLTEREDTVAVVFGLELDALFEEIFGSALEGFECAGRSYLTSGYFEAAALCFAKAESPDSAVRRLRDYALGMQAYLEREYTTSVRHLAAWAAEAGDEQEHLLPLARDAISRIGQLAEGDDRETAVREAEALAAVLGSPQPRSKKPSGAPVASEE